LESGNSANERWQQCENNDAQQARNDRRDQFELDDPEAQAQNSGEDEPTENAANDHRKRVASFPDSRPRFDASACRQKNHEGAQKNRHRQGEKHWEK
jgi:hypothetical protein